MRRMSDGGSSSCGKRPLRRDAAQQGGSLRLHTSLCMGIAAALWLAMSAAAAGDTTGVTADTITVGVPGPFTGNASSYSKAQIGIHAFYRWINDQGGIHGRRIEVIRADTACDEAKGIAATKKLIYQDKVFMIHGNSCSGVALAMKPTVVEAKIPWVVAHAVNHNISQPVNPYIFHAVPTSYDAGVAMAKFALSMPKPPKIAVIAHSNEWAKGYQDPAVAYLKQHNVEPLLTETMERGSTVATPQVLKIKNSDANFVMAILYEAETAIFLRDAHKYGLNLPVLGGYGTDLENTLTRVGSLEPVKNYHVLHMFVGTLESPPMQKWGDIIKKYYPDETLTAFSFASIGSAVAVVKGLKAAGRDLTREKFIEEMNKIRDFDTGVLASRVTFTPNDHQGAKDSAVAGFMDGKAAIFKSWGQPLKPASH